MSATLRSLYRGLEALYRTDTGLDPVDHLIAFEPRPDAAQEYLLLREDETGDTVELGLVLDARVLAGLDDDAPSEALSDARLGATLPVLEGLSHLHYVAEAARTGRPVSGLELEVQAEVDKLALCVLDRWADAERAFPALVERLFHDFELVAGLSPELVHRYETANRVAARFARHLVVPIRARRLSDLRDALRGFWLASLAEKQRLAS